MLAPTLGSRVVFARVVGSVTGRGRGRENGVGESALGRRVSDGSPVFCVASLHGVVGSATGSWPGGRRVAGRGCVFDV